MVSSIAEAVGTEPVDLANFTEFYKSVVARLQYFFVREQAAGAAAPQKFLVGRPALLVLTDSVVAMKKDGGEVPLKDFQPSRAFKWLLTSDQLVMTSNWIQAAILSHAAMMSRQGGHWRRRHWRRRRPRRRGNDGRDSLPLECCDRAAGEKGALRRRT